jgi:LPPG:FO 2-phospho-L-lactate transferase
MDSLDRLGGETWFRLGDQDLATHLYRTQRLSTGASLSEVTREITEALGVSARLVPMSDDPVRTRLTLVDGPEVSFQEYFVGHRHAVAVESLRFAGAAAARPAPGVLRAIADAEVVVVCPSNPIVSIGPLLAVPGIAEALAARRAEVVAVSPIIAGAALKGPADRLMAELGHEATVVGVARLYAEFVGTLVVDDADSEAADAVEACGVRCVVAPTVMHTPDHSAALASLLLDAGRPSGASRGART